MKQVNYIEVERKRDGVEKLGPNQIFITSYMFFLRFLSCYFSSRVLLPIIIVVGPMVYSLAYFPLSLSKKMKSMEFADSKQLTEEKREEIFEKLVAGECSNIGWFTKILSPTTISNGNFKRPKYNLNALSHDTAIELIHLAISNGIQVSEVYVDTVGPKDKYEAKLKSIFPDIKKIKVENKADSLFHVVSAASICAKVTRDRVLSSWIFPEERIESSDDVDNDTRQHRWVNYGSGYPGDPNTKSFLSSNIDPIFGFPTFVRFSWSTVRVLLEDKAIEVTWEVDEENDEHESSKNIVPITNFFKRKFDSNTDQSSSTLTKKRKVSYEDPPFFIECNMTRPTNLFS